MLSESLMLSARAVMSRPLTRAALDTEAAPKPTTSPTLVTMAAVEPKLYRFGRSRAPEPELALPIDGKLRRFCMLRAEYSPQPQNIVPRKRLASPATGYPQDPKGSRRGMPSVVRESCSQCRGPHRVRNDLVACEGHGLHG